MARAEEALWWYRALHANLLWLLDRHAPAAGAVLDAGCGTGGFLRRLAARRPGRRLVGLDLHPAAAAAAREKSGASVVVGSVNRLPFRDASFAAVISADVLYHRQADPGAAIGEAFRCLAPRGALIVNVPAFEWLRSYHDTAIHTARRFRRGEIKALFAGAGFAVAYCGYWNSLPFPAMILRRKLWPAPREGKSDLAPPPGFIHRALAAAAGLEHGLMEAGLVFPFGGSCLAVGIKND